MKKTQDQVRSLNSFLEWQTGGRGCLCAAEQVVAAPSTFIALAVRGLWEPGSCPQGTLKELQYLNSKFKGGNAQGVSEVWGKKKEQSQGRRGKVVAESQVGTVRRGGPGAGGTVYLRQRETTRGRVGHGPLPL